MQRAQDRNWFICPRCRRHAEQTWLVGAAGDQRIRWSTCGACRGITIWRGSSIVHSGPTAAIGTECPDDAGAAPAAGNAAIGRLSVLWDAVEVELTDIGATARHEATRADDARHPTTRPPAGREDR